MTGRNLASGRVKLDLSTEEAAACIDGLLARHPEATHLIRYVKNKWAQAKGAERAGKHQADATH
jgi:hypothetical protein